MKVITTKAHGKTDVGRVRATNQDSFLINADLSLFIVADGMGGHAGGEIASQLCVEFVESSLNDHNRLHKSLISGEHPNSQILQTLVQAVNGASARIYEYSLEDPSLRGMGTTATLVKVIGQFAYFAHVGDSRLYLLRQGFIYQLTLDHSWLDENLRAGVLTPEQAIEHEDKKNVITRSVGYQEQEDVDTGCIKLEPKDLLLLCSDGLHNKVSDQELAQLFGEFKLKAVEKLIDLSNERGGVDNITAVMIEID